jgi:hypothetical protein
VSKVTWLSPFLDLWREICGGEMAPGQAARALSPVVKLIGTEEAQVRFEFYLRSTPTQYASVSRFSQTHGNYAKGAQPEMEFKGLRPATQGRVVE